MYIFFHLSLFLNPCLMFMLIHLDSHRKGNGAKFPDIIITQKTEFKNKFSFPLFLKRGNSKKNHMFQKEIQTKLVHKTK